jgi:hypothetical protein
VKFLRKHVEVIVLSDKAGRGQIAVVPQWQGRIMTSTAGGEKGTSFGWVNRDLIAAGKVQPHINVYGGEDRFWLGPEGGQFSIFFAKGVKFDLEHWFTPAPIDTEAYEVVSKSADRVVCRHRMKVVNFSDTQFDLEVNRELRIVDAAQALSKLGANLPGGLNVVGFESANTIKNVGSKPWQKETGLLSIWVLGMFNATPETTVAIPIQTGDDAELGPAVNDNYFGKVPKSRLVVKGGVVYFRADAGYRSKIGISPRRAKPVMGSYDAAGRSLTLVEFTLPPDTYDYVNSSWEIQEKPYGGDPVNSYNDGSPKPGAKQLGRFYELESSSPALALKPGASARHVHRTFHLEGSERELDLVARSVLGVRLDQVKKVF